MEEPQEEECIIAQFFSTEGEAAGPQLNIPLQTNVGQLQALLNKLLNNVRSRSIKSTRLTLFTQKEELPYSFYLLEEEIIATLKHAIEERQKSNQTMSKEDVRHYLCAPKIN